MKRLLILAALLLSVVGGLTLMSSSSPLAAQTGPSATRSFEPMSVAPGGMVTVSIDIEGVTLAGTITETVPAGFTYVSTSGLDPDPDASDESVGRLVFPFLGSNDFSYVLTAPSAEASYSFSGALNPGAIVVGGSSSVTVEAIPEQTGPEVTTNEIQFDVVSSKAVKGDRVSGVGKPIASNPLKWVVEDTEMTFVGIEDNGDVGDGDFQIKMNDDGTFGLFVSESGASYSGSINVDLTYEDSDGIQLTSTLMGDINNMRSDLVITSDNEFTIPQGISDNDEDTLIGSFRVTGGIDDENKKEYLDGILSGPGSHLFAVNDGDMTLMYRGDADALEVKTYNLSLTVSGDAGLANRTAISDVTITVTASNMAPTVPDTFSPVPIKENLRGDGLLKAGTLIGDASAGVSANDGDVLTYELVGGDSDLFMLYDDNKIKVGAADIADTASSGDGTDVDYNFMITVSDGITANNRDISATVTVDANSPVALAGRAINGTLELPVTVDASDIMPMPLVGLRDLVTDPDGDPVTFAIPNNPSHVVYNEDTDELLLTYLPTAPREEPTVNIITVEANDGWNDDGPDATITITVSVTVASRPAVTSKFVGIKVAENGTVCMQDGSVGCSLAGIVNGATSYTVESGEHYEDAEGNRNYEVENDGTITVLTAPDFEDGLNPAFLVNVNAGDDLAGLISVRVEVTNVPEAPVLTELVAGANEQASEIPWVYETAQIGDPVLTKPAGNASGSTDDPETVFVATDEDADQTDSIKYSIDETGVPFEINEDTGALTVSGELNKEVADSHTFTVRATDVEGLDDDMSVTVKVQNANEAPEFTAPLGDDAVTTVAENIASSVAIFTFTATDEDGDDLTFALRQGQSQDLFEIRNAGSSMVNGKEVWSGDLHAKAGVLDYEDDTYDARVHVEVNDPDGLNDTLLLTVNLSNVNDNDPVFDGNPSANVSVVENTARGHVMGNYSASDADRDTVHYSLSGANAKSFQIGDTGDLMTLESLDYDNAGTPCGTDHQCVVDVVASDGERSVSMSVTITITAAEDSVSTLDVSKANPVPGTQMGNPMSALSNAKDAINKDVPEAPADIPASYGDAPLNFVETAWANWGTVLRIAVTSESPDPTCGNGNQCVVVNVNSDSADDSLKLQAYRSADKENEFVAALMLVELSSDATPGDAAVYKHTDGGVAALKVDEEDEVEVEYGNLRDTVDVENEAPEVSNFAPEHERAFDDADVDYTFTITDDQSGLPEPEDLPDTDGDENYTPVVALISKSSGGMGQCSVATAQPEGTEGVLSAAAHIHEDDTLYCPGDAQDGEYVASEGGYGFAPIRDDKDFDEIDDGYDVETTIVLTENDTYYVTFIVCDNAGNCAYHDPDGNDDDEELAEITVDTLDPVFVEARTGLKWDSTDNEYDDDRSYIQVIFNDLTQLNAATVEVDDFVVEGHTIKSVSVYENPDKDDVDWDDSGRYAKEGHRNLRHIDRYRDLENVVFLELEDELLADETPDVTIVPNGVEDSAGNEQDDGDHEANDWISPKFTVVSIVSTRETSQDEVLAGDDDEVTVVVTSDERLDQTRPTVTVTYVNAPSGKVDTKGTASCKVDKDTNGTRDRGEIVLTDYCQDSSAAKGGTLNNSVEKVSNTEWIVTITEPKDTGYYSFRIQGIDRSPQENPGSEGIAADDIVTDFFDSDGDVNVDDAVFFEGDINLAKPNVRVSGAMVTDNEPDVEYRNPLFVEIDFTQNHMGTADCGSDEDSDHLLANCMNENSEYAEDNFDDVVITMFELDGVDMTDSVKTTDDQTFLVTLENVALGDHTAKIQAMDVAGNTLEDILEIDFEVSDRDPFERRLNPGWNLVSLPGEPSDSAIGSVFGPGVEVRTVYTYDPVVPGGWMVAVRESLDSAWQGDLTEITGSRGYWVLSDAIQDWEVSIPRLAGGAAGTGTPIQPPVIPLYAGWNLIPVTDISGNGSGGDPVSADVYLQNLDDGLDLARVLGFDTIRNQWETVLDPDMQMNNTLEIGSAYWIFVREAASLVPSGYISGGGSD